MIPISPERLRGLDKRTRPVNWEAVALTVERATGTALQKRLMLTRLKKAVRKHGVEAMTPQWRYSYCCARLYLKDYSDYWGWEFRDSANADETAGWAASLYWEETWLAKWGGGYVPRLLVLGEQGVGDAIFFSSILPEAMVRAKEVVYECDSRLHKLLERSLPGLKCETEKPFEDRRDGRFEVFIPASDLMRMFRKEVSHFPGRAFLKPDPDRNFERYRGRTGVCWKGRQGSFDPMELGIENPLSLQYGETHPRVESPENADGSPLDLFHDIEGVVALCSVLAKLVTPPQSAHHFAGAVGVKTEIIRAPGSGLENQIPWDTPPGKLPWYPDATVFSSINEWKHAS